MQNIKTFITMVKQEFYIMTTRQKWMSVFLVVVVFVGGLCEMIGVAALLPFVQALTDLEAFCKKGYAVLIINLFHLKNANNVIFVIAFLIVVVYILKNTYLLWSLNLQYKFQYEFQTELSSRMLACYMRRPYEYFLNVNSNQVLRCVEGDTKGVFAIYEFITKMLSEVLTILFTGGLLFYVDFFMAVGILTISLTCVVCFTFVFRLLLHGVGEKKREADFLASKYAYQAVNGIKEIYVLKKNEFFIRKYDEANKQKSKLERRYRMLGSCPEKFIETSCVAGMIITLCLRISMGVDLKEFVPTLSAFAVAAFRILPAISRFVGLINGLIYHRPMLEAVYDQMIEVEEYEALTKKYIKEHKHSDPDTNIRFENNLEIRNIRWKYPNADNNVLCDLNLTINRGEAIGLIGPSGAGKTTLSDLILGLFQPQQGSILMDGIDIYTIPQEWSSIVGYVPQSVYLADDTIRNNIAFGTDESMIDDEKVWSALKQAQLFEVVSSLPKGLDTFVGERGIRFSGGQRQRIAIARALYYDPDILVLDEATSALDNETESAVMEAIDMLQGEKTLIIVAHRLSTLKNCDKIYEVNNGKAVATTI